MSVNVPPISAANRMLARLRRLSPAIFHPANSRERDLTQIAAIKPHVCCPARSPVSVIRASQQLSRVVILRGSIAWGRVWTQAPVAVRTDRLILSEATGGLVMSTWRRDNITRFIYGWAKGVLPTLSATEREAIEAGDVWWDAEIFTGNPDWSKLLAVPEAKLSAEEQAFLDGPAEELCRRLDEWNITWELRDLPEDVWEFLKEKKFFAMIIPKEYGGLGFSAYAHSEVVRKLATRSVTSAVTAMVPNSLGPGELLLQFGTKEQRDYWLPRLADGREIPCFGLTSPEAGSDAASMTDSRVVCRGIWQGREMLGIRLNWHKRYITLGPVATVLGLAFKLRDPDHLIGPEEDIGITVALVPANLPGIKIGRRHLPAMQVF